MWSKQPAPSAQSAQRVQLQKAAFGVQHNIQYGSRAQTSGSNMSELSSTTSAHPCGKSTCRVQASSVRRSPQGQRQHPKPLLIPAATNQLTPGPMLIVTRGHRRDLGSPNQRGPPPSPQARPARAQTPLAPAEPHLVHSQPGLWQVLLPKKAARTAWIWAAFNASLLASTLSARDGEWCAAVLPFGGAAGFSA